jgi:hypothetical protein
MVNGSSIDSAHGRSRGRSVQHIDSTYHSPLPGLWGPERVSDINALDAAEIAHVRLSLEECEVRGYEDLLLFLISDLFTPLVGYRRGILPLRMIGVDRIGDLIGMTRTDLRCVPGFGARRIAKLESGLALAGLELGRPSPSWKPLPIPEIPAFARRGLQLSG